MNVYLGSPRYALALYRGPAMVGFVPGLAGATEPVAEPRLARKFSLPADALIAAEDLAVTWALVHYQPMAWDLVKRIPL